MQVTYQVKEDQIVTEQNVIQTIYGIEIRQGETQIRLIPNIFCDKAATDALVELCNRLELSPEHIDDVITDTLASI